MSTSFSATFDVPTRIVSALAIIGFTAAVVLTRNPFVVGLTVLALGIAFAWSPRGYILEEGTLIIRRLIGNVRFPLAELREARPAARDDLRGCVRLWGNGGLFGYYGLYVTRKLGKCTWYVTNRKRILVLSTGAKTILISPDDSDSFLNTLRATVPLKERPSSALLYESAGLFPVQKVIGISVAAAVLAIVLFTIFWTPGPPSYTLTSESLTIHDFFYPVTVQAGAVDVSNIRVVDLSLDREWRPTARTNGFGSPHYKSGWFKVAGGQKVRMYRADGDRLVLLPPAGSDAPVLLEAKDPENFLLEVRRAWAR